MSALDKTGLEPCPFCGGKDLVSEGDDKIVGYRCRTCEATGPNHYNSRFDWNRRASTTSAGVTEEQAPRVTDAMVEAACAATVLGEDEFGKPVHLSPAEARCALEASRVAPVSQKEADDALCPICSVPFKIGDTCARDIELGECHAECLAGSTVVDLETGKPTDAIDIYPYEPLSGADEGSLLSDPEIGVTSSPAARESEASAASSPSSAPAVEPLGIKALELDWSGFSGVTRNKAWAPDLQDLVYTALNFMDGEGDADDDAAEQIIERLLDAIRTGIKALEWDDIAGKRHVATTVVGIYTIVRYHSRFALVRPQDSFDGFGYAFEGPLAYCKAAAQADYEARIRSALHPTPTPVSAPVGVVEALQPFATFAEHAVEWGDNSWVWKNSQNERICDWFGPSDFGLAKRAALVAPSASAQGEDVPHG